MIPTTKSKSCQDCIHIGYQGVYGLETCKHPLVRSTAYMERYGNGECGIEGKLWVESMTSRWKNKIYNYLFGVP